MKTGEWAIVGDEGIVEDQFYSKEEADKALLDRYSPEDELWVEEKDYEDDEEEEDDEDDEDDEEDDDDGYDYAETYPVKY